ncbi:MAG: SEC-C metal-binding domain-containing protein [Planctomycetota bacterium]
MTNRKLLDVAAFLDSSHAAQFAPDVARGIAERWITACYEDLGQAPRLLDGEEVRMLLAEHLASRFRRRDPLAEHVPDVARALLSHLEETELVPNAFEQRLALEQHLDAFQLAVDAEGPRRSPRPVTVEHHADKLGRNEPCFCGSGRKFKKCCGKGA